MPDQLVQFQFPPQFTVSCLCDQGTSLLIEFYRFSLVEDADIVCSRAKNHVCVNFDGLAVPLILFHSMIQALRLTSQKKFPRSQVGKQTPTWSSSARVSNRSIKRRRSSCTSLELSYLLCFRLLTKLCVSNPFAYKKGAVLNVVA